MILNLALKKRPVAGFSGRRSLHLHVSMKRPAGSIVSYEVQRINNQTNFQSTNPWNSSLGVYYDRRCHCPIKQQQIRWFSSQNDEETNKEKLQQLEEDLKIIANKESIQFWAHWKKEIQSPPNVITTTRILFAPVLSYFIVSGQHQLALYGCMVAAASDWVDGYLARNYNMSTVLGAFLDPMADKIIINVLSLSLWYTEMLPTPLVILWFGKDFLLIFGTAAYIRMKSKDVSMAYDPVTTPLKVLPTKTSKINTALQFATLGVGIVFPLYNIPPEVLTGLW